MEEIVMGMPFNEKRKPKSLAIGIKKDIAVFSPLDHVDGVIAEQYRMQVWNGLGLNIPFQ